MVKFTGPGRSTGGKGGGSMRPLPGGARKGPGRVTNPLVRPGKPSMGGRLGPLGPGGMRPIPGPGPRPRPPSGGGGRGPFGPIRPGRPSAGGRLGGARKYQPGKSPRPR